MLASLAVRAGAGGTVRLLVPPVMVAPVLLHHLLMVVLLGLVVRWLLNLLREGLLVEALGGHLMGFLDRHLFHLDLIGLGSSTLEGMLDVLELGDGSVLRNDCLILTLLARKVFFITVSHGFGLLFG